MLGSNVLRVLCSQLRVAIAESFGYRHEVQEWLQRYPEHNRPFFRTNRTVRKLLKSYKTLHSCECLKEALQCSVGCNNVALRWWGVQFSAAEYFFFYVFVV
jgi:hypothetical protein